MSIVFLGITAQGQAEVHIRQDRITIHVQEITIQAVLHLLAEQGQFNIVALEESRMKHVRISKRFWNLPLEEGLARIFSSWNYGLGRDPKTGKITTLYLVSPRTPSFSHVKNFHKTNLEKWDAQNEHNLQITKLASELNNDDELEFPDLEEQ